MTLVVIGYFCMCNCYRTLASHLRLGVEGCPEMVSSALLIEAILCGNRRRIIVTLRKISVRSGSSWPADLEVE